MKTSEKIITLLSTNGPYQVAEIANALGLTRADIRYHLKLLLSTHQVNISGEKGIYSRGRPAPRYELVTTIQMDTAIELLEYFSEYLTQSSCAKSIEMVAEELWQNISQKLELSSSPHIRLNQILSYLKTLGVESSWLAGKNGPLIKIITNPFKVKNPQSFHRIMDSLLERALNSAIID